MLISPNIVFNGISMHFQRSQKDQKGDSPDPHSIEPAFCLGMFQPATFDCHKGKPILSKFVGKIRTFVGFVGFPSLRNRNAHGHLTRGILCENSLENAAPQNLAPRFVRACAVEMHMDMSQEAFSAEICRENAKCPGYHLD
jgi:hypothetical protein